MAGGDFNADFNFDFYKEDYEFDLAATVKLTGAFGLSQADHVLTVAAVIKLSAEFTAESEITIPPPLPNQPGSWTFPVWVDPTEYRPKPIPPARLYLRGIVKLTGRFDLSHRRASSAKVDATLLLAAEFKGEHFDTVGSDNAFLLMVAR